VTSALSLKYRLAFSQVFFHSLPPESLIDLRKEDRNPSGYFVHSVLYIQYGLYSLISHFDHFDQVIGDVKDVLPDSKIHTNRLNTVSHIGQQLTRIHPDEYIA
jgi:hypothetical protein